MGTGKILVINSFGAKFKTTFVVCFFFFYFNILSFGKTFICEDERLNSNSVDPDETAHWIYAVCKSLLLSPMAVKELNKFS